MRLVEGRSLLCTISLLIATGLITVVQAGATLDDGLLSLEERVGCQRAIEEVYWRHRIWPAQNPGPKPALGEVLPDAVLRERVATYLQKGAALEIFRQRPLTGDQLQTELNRMVRDTRNPELLRELFAALDDDPLLAAECLARPVLVNRLTHNWYASETHGIEHEPADTTKSIVPPVGGYLLASPAENGCIADSWNELWYSPRSTDQTAVWTGSEMIVWGGEDGDPLNTGGRYDPATDSWTQTSKGIGVPAHRTSHTAIWTGTEMIVWGGEDGSDAWNDGGRYDPLTDSWTATSTGPGVPTARQGHTAVWTGAKMIVWGGADSVGELRTGGAYDPVSDSWTTTWTGLGVPAARSGHTAIWTGSVMIVWGGGEYLNTGGRYDPLSDSWLATSIGTDVPSERTGHTAVWSGSEMIVWGGFDSPNDDNLNTGGRYDPVTDSWTPTSEGSELPDSRRYHTAVWTGSEMIVWGGIHYDSGFQLLNSGGKYDVATDSWTATSTGNDVPGARANHSAVWTGTEMIVWGGYQAGSLDTGGRYDPVTDSWVATAAADAGLPAATRDRTAVWTGAEMIVWGGDNNPQNTGGRYDPATDAWTATTEYTGTQMATHEFSAVWTGTEMIVWGGRAYWHKNTGGAYNPSTDSWTETSTGFSVPRVRAGHTAVWTGTEMIVWGGNVVITVNDMVFNLLLKDGGRYDPASDSWTASSIGTGVPTERSGHTAVWTGREMIVWGGFVDGDGISGGRYNPELDSWKATSTAAAVPARRTRHTAVWTGSEMIVWGGTDWAGFPLDTGGRYDPLTDSWTTVSTATDAPVARASHSAVWTGAEMIVWAGGGGEGYPFVDLNDGGRYDPGTNSWTATSTDAGTPTERGQHSAVWTGTEMIVWGGYSGVYLNTGGLYCVCEGGTVSDWYPDADGDGLGANIPAVPACEQPSGYVAVNGDCHDRYASCTTDCTDADADGTPACAPDCDDSNPYCTTDCTDSDADTYCVTHDCDDSNPDTHPGAEEVNDGLDNHCLYDPGYGLIDEITSVCGFHNPDDLDEFSWTAQAGATSYEVARSPHRRFNTDCLVSEIAATQWIDTDAVPAGVCFYYLVRSTQPNVGSWGYGRPGVERNAICP